MPVTALSYVTVTGTFKRPDGSAAQGAVEFRPSTRVVDTTTNQAVLPEGTSSQLDSTGAFSISLPCTDDPDFSPIGWTYEVRELVDVSPRTYNILLPASPSTFDLADAVPTDSPLFPFVRSMSGHFADRPLATAGVGYYFADDVNGGTLYYSNGTTWAQVAPGVNEVGSGLELAYAEITSDLSTGAVGTANQIDAVGLLVAVPASTRPIEVIFNGWVYNTVATDGIWVAIVEAAVGDANRTPERNGASVTSSTNSAIKTMVVRTRQPASAVARTFKIQFCAIGGGVAHIFGAPSVAGSPQTVISLTAKTI